MATVLGSSLIVIGAVVVVLILLALCAVVLDWFHRRVVIPWVVRVEQAEHDRLRVRLRYDAWWFSEDTPTMALLNEMASPCYDVAHARENWRKARATKGDE